MAGSDRRGQAEHLVEKALETERSGDKQDGCIKVMVKP